jgi:hypothetical protein
MLVVINYRLGWVNCLSLCSQYGMSQRKMGYIASRCAATRGSSKMNGTVSVYLLTLVVKPCYVDSSGPRNKDADCEYSKEKKRSVDNSDARRVFAI